MRSAGAPLSESRPYAVILAGGGGTRLWPLSTPEIPKPFIPLHGSTTLLGATLERLLPLIPIDDCYVICADAHAPLVRAVLPQLDERHIVVEPSRRNTGPTVALAAASIDRRDDAPMIVLPADHAVADPAAWRAALAAAIGVAIEEPSALVTLGVVPTGPETGFGYIIATGGRVERFVEKPDASSAAQLIAAGARWNAGTFVWRRAAILSALHTFAPEVLDGLGEYDALAPMPIDTLVMEPAAAAGLVRTVPLDCGWSDVGSWRSLRAHLRSLGAVDASGDVRIATGEGRTVMIAADGRVAVSHATMSGRTEDFTVEPERMSDAEIRAAAAAEASTRGG